MRTPGPKCPLKQSCRSGFPAGPPSSHCPYPRERRSRCDTRSCPIGSGGTADTSGRGTSCIPPPGSDRPAKCPRSGPDRPLLRHQTRRLSSPTAKLVHGQFLSSGAAGGVDVVSCVHWFLLLVVGHRVALSGCASHLCWSAAVSGFWSRRGFRVERPGRRSGSSCRQRKSGAVGRPAWWPTQSGSNPAEGSRPKSAPTTSNQDEPRCARQCH